MIFKLLLGGRLKSSHPLKSAEQSPYPSNIRMNGR